MNGDKNIEFFLDFFEKDYPMQILENIFKKRSEYENT